MSGLGQRLVVAFIGVALATVATEIAVASVTATAQLRQFVNMQRANLARTATRAAGEAYADRGRWNSAEVQPVIELLGTSNHAALRVRDSSGEIVAESPGYAGFAAGGVQLSYPVVVSGARVGSVTVSFDHGGLGTAATRLEAAQWRARIYAAAIAVLLAIVVSIVASRRITAPLERMLGAIRARTAGDRNVRIQDVHAVGVLGDLLEGFNAGADALDRRELEQRNLIAGIAHELRTRVAVLQAGHEAMLDGIIEPVPENLASMRDEVLRLSRLLEDLRALSAAEAASLQLRLVEHDLADVAADAASSLSEPLKMSGLELKSRLSATRVMCDYDRMRDVVTNLLTNAMKYTTAGGSITLETGPVNRGQARLLVSDNGVGIPSDELPRLTERFFRGRRTSNMAGGSGLGLAIVAELVRAHHGELDITSGPGPGTQVTVTLPVAPRPVMTLSAPAA
jgi:two-component system sensor histidine kinase BaeS